MFPVRYGHYPPSVLMKDRTVNNINNCDGYINISSQSYRCYTYFILPFDILSLATSFLAAGPSTRERGNMRCESCLPHVTVWIIPQLLLQFVTNLAYLSVCIIWGARGSVVVKALCYKPEGRGFETRWSEWFLSSYLIFPVALDPGVYSASKRNEYQKHKNNVSGVRRADNLTAICEPIV
jgi:hypothetical protein